jgi:hypothetical protein
MSPCNTDLQPGERVTDLTDWTHATVSPSGTYRSTIVKKNCEPMVTLLYDDGRRRDFVPLWSLVR